MATTQELTVDASTVALWHMDGTVGSAGKKEDAAATYDITESGTPTTGNGFNAESNGNYTFDGSSNYCTVADNAALRPASVTVEIWFKAAATGNSAIIDKGNLGGDYAIFLESGNLKFRVRTDSTDRTVDGGAFSDTASWHYAVLTYGSNTLKGYLDGNQVGSDVSATGTYNTGTNNISIGAASGGTQKFNGSVDECRISNAVRTATEINNYYNAIYPVTLTDTVSLSDTLTADRTMTATLTETVSLTDTLTAVGVLVTTLIDTVSLTDTLTNTATYLWTRRTEPTTTWSTTSSPTTTWIPQTGWNYIFEGTHTPAQLGWVESINTGTATESTADGLYRITATTDFRKNYVYPDNGTSTDAGFGVDFSAGFTLEWRAIYTLGGGGTVQSNVYIGDSDELIRVFIDRSANRLDLRWATGVVHTSSAVISQWNTYKLVVLGTSGSFYVNGVLEGTFSRSNTGSSTKYLRFDNRIVGGGTLDVSYAWLRVLKGTDPEALNAWTSITRI